MSQPTGRFVWYELATTDQAAAAAFYGTAIGWTAADAGEGYGGYMILSAGESMVAGLMTLPQQAREAGARPGWRGYIGVDDVDAAASRLEVAGGKVRRAPEDIPNVGRFAPVTDPQGAAFVLFKPFMGPDRPAEADDTPGRVGWHELYAADWPAAFAFYAGMFGWTKDRAHDMGVMGTYQLFATGGGTAVGGMMTKPDMAPSAGWLYYFNVTDTDAAAGRVREAGGQVLHGPMQVPGGQWIAQCMDPQGVMFAVVGPDRPARG